MFSPSSLSVICIFAHTAMNNFPRPWVLQKSQKQVQTIWFHIGQALMITWLDIFLYDYMPGHCPSQNQHWRLSPKLKEASICLDLKLSGDRPSLSSTLAQSLASSALCQFLYLYKLKKKHIIVITAQLFKERESLKFFNFYYI